MITKDTKISKIINQNKLAIDVIASVNKNFRKLQNPFLRKLLAPRVSVKDAAKIGGTTANIILKKLEDIGFVVEYDDQNMEETNLSKYNELLDMKNKKIVKLDVRPILESGTDPFHAIMESLKTLNADETLLIVNSFEPVPLLNKLEKKGYDYKVERPEDKVVYTFVTKSKEEKQDIVETKNESKAMSFEQAEQNFKDKMKEVDVRDLEMPMPMVTILQEVETMNDNDALYVHHKRLPQYLLPELENRGYIYATKEVDENNIKFIIYKK